MDPYRPNFLDMPNKMYPLTWVVLGIVLAAILAGFLFLFLKWRKASVKWAKLTGSALNARYFGEGHEPNVPLLVMSLGATVDYLIQHTTWKAADIVSSLSGVRVYVMPTKAWKDGQGQTVAGLDPSGPVVVVGVDLAALLHECAHQCEERIDRAVDYAHAGWEAKGIRKAEDEFAKWLSTQRVASGITYLR